MQRYLILFIVLLLLQIHLACAQYTWHLAAGLRTNYVYANRVLSNTDRYDYEGGYANPFFEGGVTYRVDSAWQVRVGLNLTYTAHTARFKIEESNGTVDKVYKTQIRSFRLPVYMVRSVLGKHGVFLGASFNYNQVYGSKVDYKFRFSSGTNYAASFTSKFQDFITMSLIPGVQVCLSPKTNLLLFADMDLFGYPKVSVANTITNVLTSTSSEYWTQYRPRLVGVSAGIAYRVY